MIEITFTREELRHLYDVLLRNHLQVRQSVIDKIGKELIADEIFDLLDDLECLDAHLEEEWQEKLWYDDPEDEHTIAVKRDPKMWNRQTIAELKTLIAKLEAK
jgi:hypothetical protein